MAKKNFIKSSGRTISIEFDSKLLSENPLGDPSSRQIDVWLPPQYDQSKGIKMGKRFPVLFDLAGYAGSGKSHTNWKNFDENIPERAARLLHEKKLEPFIIVFPDCFTSLGGNQYVNSPAIGPYADYLTKELIPLIDKEFRTKASRDHRGCFGKSSGGYGAMIHGMKYSRYWGAIANHSGDSYFDFVYRSEWPKTLTHLGNFTGRKRSNGRINLNSKSNILLDGIDDGRVKSFLKHVWKKQKLTSDDLHCLMNLAMAATYDPDISVANNFRLPFNLETGEIIPMRWKQWLKHDPINLVNQYKHNLKKLRGIFIDCGWKDQYHIHYGTRILSKKMQHLKIPHIYEEFDGTHSGIDYRLDISIPYLLKALS
ncbi:MAG: alpha/beta hydrolase-fold protein [Pseudomonadota bacterium]|nr:enterochelin esterase [Gammaproteobacteria bacterium]MEE2683666.1 alpha/beta hydrolase-fold protein [Pseudomonadota bacterium]